MSVRDLDYQSLKKRHRDGREGYHPNLTLRVHRALSWLQCAEHQEDLDSKFVFFRIAFNEAYATEIDDNLRSSEKNSFSIFLEKLVALDSDNLLENLTWNEFPKSIRILLNNKFVYQPFWDFHNGRLTETEWINQFDQANTAAQAALRSGKTALVLSIVLSRIYILRNQLVHGGATWRSSVNRDQVRDCVAIMNKLVPIVLEIMMDNPRTLWSDPYYPVVQ